MTALIPGTPGHPDDDARPHRELVEALDPRTEREVSRRRWEFAALRWRALALARAIFGAEARLDGSSAGVGGFRGIVRLRVPFASLDAHREREARFVAWAARDDVLGPASLVYVFSPAVAPAAS